MMVIQRMISFLLKKTQRNVLTVWDLISAPLQLLLQQSEQKMMRSPGLKHPLFSTLASESPFSLPLRKFQMIGEYCSDFWHHMIVSFREWTWAQSISQVMHKKHQFSIAVSLYCYWNKVQWPGKLREQSVQWKNILICSYGDNFCPF